MSLDHRSLQRIEMTILAKAWTFKADSVDFNLMFTIVLVGFVAYVTFFKICK